MFQTVTSALDWLGIIAFTVTGALVASRKQMDVVGFVMLGTVTGIGGGTLRDVLLGLPGSSSRLARRGRPSETAPAGFAPGYLHFPSKAPNRRTALAKPDSRMSTFLEFLSAAADFALTLNLKAAIVAAGFVVMLMLTRRRGAE